MNLAKTALYVGVATALTVVGALRPAHAAPAMAGTATSQQANAPETTTAMPHASAQKDEQSKTDGKGGSSDLKTLGTVIVTGVPTVGGVTVHEANFIATTMDRQQITKMNAVNSDDLLRAIPGVFPEPTGGQGGNNVDVAGYPAGNGLTFITYQIEGMPVWPLYLEKNIGNFFDSLIRFDDTISSFQSIQGGSSVVSANGQPGVSANLLLRRGQATPSGDIGVTALSEGGYRIDGFVGGPVAHTGWRASVGGYQLSSNGVRSPGYPADKGSQLTATLSKDFDKASLIFYARRLNQRDQFVTDTPLINERAGEFLAYPMFDPLTGTFSSRQNRYLFLASEACSTPACAPGGDTYDFQWGRGARMNLVGLNFEYFGDNGWSFADGFQIMNAFAPTYGFYSTGQNPVPLSQAIAQQAARNGFAPGTYTAAATLTTSQPISEDALVTAQTPSVQQNRPRAISNQFKFTREFGNGNTLSGGLYAVTTQNSRFAINAPYRILLQAKSNPAPVVVQLTNNDGAVLPLTDNQGIFTVPAATAPGGDNYETWHENIAAIFLSDTYKSDKWVLTAGGRIAEDWVHGYYHLTKNVDMDANPNTLYNNFGQIFLPQTQRLEYKNTLRSWMVGATFLINDTSSVYSNISYGVAPNHFDTIRSIPQAANVVQTIHSYVIGYRFATSHLFLSVEGFHRQFLHDNAVFNLADGSTVLSFGQGQRANGVLAQLRAGPFKGFSISLVADAQDGRLIDPSCQEFVNQAGQQVCHSSSGEHPNRQPNFQYVVRPEYRADLPFGFLELWASFNHVGYHTATADASLGMYNDIGIGAQLGVGEHWRFTLRGTNVTDNIGLTEGNARIFAGAQNLGGVILARGIEGHEYNLQIRYSF